MRPTLFFVALAALSTPAGAFIDSNLAVSPGAQASGGGCYATPLVPGLLDMLTLVDPEWAAIDVGSHLPPFSDPITLHGTVALAKINEGGDLPADHESDDQNTFITLDAADQGFVATGNVGPHGEEGGQLEVEWEIGKYPLFAWAGRADRLTGVGRWIWDCGHPDPDPPGSCSVTTTQPCAIDADCASPTCSGCTSGETCVGVTWNYHSELHPPQAVAVTRTGGYKHFAHDVRAGHRSTRTDVWISPDGGGAGDTCELTHQANPFSLLGIECHPLSHPVANVNASDFTFDIPLPPRPPNNPRPPRVRAFDRTPNGLPRAKVLTTFVDGPAPKVHVVVKTSAPVHGHLPSTVGKTIIAGWRPDPAPVTHVQIQVTAIEIVNALKPVTPAVALMQRCSVTTSQDCSMSACPTGESCLTLGGPIPGWTVFLEVNGDWRALPDLGTVSAPVTVPQNLTYDLGVLTGDTLHLHATGHSLDCREGQLYGLSFQRALSLYGFFPGATCLNTESHNIGTFDVDLAGPDYGSGGTFASFVTSSVGGNGGHCSVTTSQICLVDADCPSGESCVVTGGAYKLHYTITKLPLR